MLIRDAAIGDLARIVEIYNSAIPGRMATADLEPVTVDSRQQWYDEHSANVRPLWVVEDEAKIMGWLSLQSFYGRPAYHATAEVSVYVAPEGQRKGLGRCLLSRAVERASQLGIKTMLAFIFGHNEPSLRLFRAFDFETWARLSRVAELDGIERDLLILAFASGERGAGTSERTPRRMRSTMRRAGQHEDA